MLIYVGIDAIKIQKDQFQQLNPFPTIKYSILPRTKWVVYSTDDLSILSRPAMVISETAITSNHYLDSHADIQRVRFTAIPFAFLDRRDWNDIRRGVTSAETEMQVGESKRRIPFLILQLLEIRLWKNSFIKILKFIVQNHRQITIMNLLIVLNLMVNMKTV